MKDLTRRSKIKNNIFRHNELAVKLEVMDIIAVEIGGKPDVAIATLAELNYERKIIYDELEQEGIKGKIFNNFLEKQMSSLTLSLNETKVLVENLNNQKKKVFLAYIFTTP